MAKTTKAKGDTYTARELNDPNPPVRIRRPMLGEVDKPSVGSNLETSSENETKTKSSETQSPRSPAPVTESLSSGPETVTDSDADTTVTDGQRKTQQPSDDKPVKSTPAKKTTGKARARQVDESEFD